MCAPQLNRSTVPLFPLLHHCCGSVIVVSPVIVVDPVVIVCCCIMCCVLNVPVVVVCFVVLSCCVFVHKMQIKEKKKEEDKSMNLSLWTEWHLICFLLSINLTWNLILNLAGDEGNDTVQFLLLNSKVNNRVKISQQWPKLEHNMDFTTSTPCHISCCNA